MQQTELQKLLAASFAEFERRVRRARARAAGIEGFHAGSAQSEVETKTGVEPMRIEELVA